MSAASPRSPASTSSACDFLYSFTSENVGGVKRDAKRIVKHIAGTGRA